MDKNNESLATTSKYISGVISERILKGEVKEGTRLKILDLAEEFHVSQMVVREALAELEKSYFVERKSRRGSVVRPLTDNDAIELFEIKQRMISYALGIICRKGKTNPDVLDGLREVFIKFSEALEEENPDNCERTSVDVIRYIIDNNGNYFLSDMLSNIENQNKRFHIHTVYATVEGRLVAKNHVSMILSELDNPAEAERRMINLFESLKQLTFSNWNKNDK